MSQSLDKLFEQIQKDSEKMAMGAMMSAANKAYALAVEEAKKCLQNYLKKKPKVYKRINPSPLAKASTGVKPTLVEKGGKCMIVFGIKYNSDRIKGVYKSNSWYHQSGDTWVSWFSQNGSFNHDGQDNGIPDSGWILNNYLEGVHPGYDRYGGNHGWVDAQKPAETMRKFFEEELYAKAGSLIYEAMQGAIVDFISSNGGGK